MFTANLTDWIIRGVSCSHIVQKKHGAEKIIKFAPQEFEKEYTHVEMIEE
jgi:hypothetical protein